MCRCTCRSAQQPAEHVEGRVRFELHALGGQHALHEIAGGLDFVHGVSVLLEVAAVLVTGGKPPCKVVCPPVIAIIARTRLGEAVRAMREGPGCERGRCACRRKTRPEGRDVTVAQGVLVHTLGKVKVELAEEIAL